MLTAVLRSAASVARKVLRLPTQTRSAGPVMFADDFAPTVRGRQVWLSGEDLDERRFGRPPVLAGRPEAEATQIQEPESVAVPEEATVVFVDHDTAENRVFAKSHPRHADAREAAIAYLAAKGAPASAAEIAEHVRGPGGVPEFKVPVKSLSNRLVTFGLVKAVVEGKVVWSPPSA